MYQEINTGAVQKSSIINEWKGGGEKNMRGESLKMLLQVQGIQIQQNPVC